MGKSIKLKLQYFGHLMRRVDSLEKTLMLGGIGGRRRRGQQKMRWLDGITDSMDMSLSKLPELVMVREACCSPWGRTELDMTKATYEFEQAPGVGDEQGSVVCCSPWSRKELTHWKRP